jgi:hypothetical protein
MGHIYNHKKTKFQDHHNPYMCCPFCSGDDVWMVPPSLGQPGIYYCSDCITSITPVSKKKK